MRVCCGLQIPYNTNTKIKIKHEAFLGQTSIGKTKNIHLGVPSLHQFRGVKPTSSAHSVKISLKVVKFATKE